MCNVKSPHGQHVLWNLFCLSVVFVIDILNLLGVFVPNVICMLPV